MAEVPQSPGTLSHGLTSIEEMAWAQARVRVQTDPTVNLICQGCGCNVETKCQKHW